MQSCIETSENRWKYFISPIIDLQHIETKSNKLHVKHGMLICNIRKFRSLIFEYFFFSCDTVQQNFPESSAEYLSCSLKGNSRYLATFRVMGIGQRLQTLIYNKIRFLLLILSKDSNAYAASAEMLSSCLYCLVDVLIVWYEVEKSKIGKKKPKPAPE